MAKKKSKTAAANAARRKQGPTKRTDYKNGRPITAAAKKKAKRTSSGSGKRTGGRQSSNPGGSSMVKKTRASAAAGSQKYIGASRNKVTKRLSQKRVDTMQQKAQERNKAGVTVKGRQRAGQAFKKKYQSIEKEYKNLGMKPDKKWLRAKAHEAAIKSSKRAGSHMARTYAKAQARKIGIKSKRGQTAFAQGYVNAAIKQA